MSVFPSNPQRDIEGIPLGELLAHGRTADLHAFNGGTVVKLFHQWIDRSSVEYEARAAHAARVAGLPTPAAKGLITRDGRSGLIYERVKAPSMLALLQQKPWRLFDFAARLARLHARIHRANVEADLFSVHQKLEHKIQSASALSEVVRSAALKALATMPAGRCFCHGDFHPGNVLLPAGGEAIIDWADAAIGNPLADVARSSLIMQAAVVSGFIASPLVRRMAGLFPRLYLRFYWQQRPGGRAELQAWLPIIAAARLSEGIPEEEAWLLAYARRLAP